MATRDPRSGRRIVMANGYNPQVPSPIAPMGEPSEKQKALLPLMNKMRQDMMAAGINPDDRMMPPNLTGTMPPGGGPPPPSMAPPPVSSGLPPAPTPSPLRPSNTMPSIAGPDSMPVNNYQAPSALPPGPPIPRPQPAPGGPPAPVNPALQGTIGTPNENQRLMGSSTMLPMHTGGTLLGQPQPQDLGPTDEEAAQTAAHDKHLADRKADLEKQLAALNAQKAAAGGEADAGAKAVAASNAGLKAVADAERRIESGEIDVSDEAMDERKTVTVTVDPETTETPEVPLKPGQPGYITDEQKKWLEADRDKPGPKQPGESVADHKAKWAAWGKKWDRAKVESADKIAQKDIAPKTPRKEGDLRGQMADLGAKASVTKKQFSTEPAHSIGSGAYSQGLGALSNMAGARQLGGIPEDVMRQYLAYTGGSKHRSNNDKKRWWLGHMVAELRRIYDATPIQKWDETHDDPNKHTPIYDPADRAKRQQAYDDIIANFSSVMNWTGGEGGASADERKRELLEMLTAHGTIFNLSGIGTEKGNPAYHTDPGGKKRDDLITEGLRSIIANQYKPMPGPTDEPGIAQRWGRSIRGVFQKDPAVAQLQLPLAIQRAIKRDEEANPGGDAEARLAMKWGDPRVLKELMYMTSDPKLQREPGKRFKDHFRESFALQFEQDGHTNLDGLAKAWEEAMPGMGKKFAQHIIATAEEGKIGNIAVTGLDRQLLNLKQVHIKGEAPLIGSDRYSEEAGEGDIETVEVDGREYMRLGVNRPQYQEQAVDPDTGEPIVDPETGDPLFDINITPLGGAITREHPDFDESKAAPVLNKAVAAAAKKASIKQAQVAQAKQNKQKKVQRDEISDLEAEMGRIYETDMAKRKKAGEGAPASLAEEANSISKNILEREISTSNKKLDDQKFLLEFSKMFSTSLHQMGDSMIAMAAGLRPGEVKEYVPTSINEALTAVGAKKEAALMRLSTFAMTGHMFPQGTSAASMKAQIPMLEHSQNLQQKSEQFLATQKQKTYESWLNYRKDVLGMKVDMNKEKWLRQKFEREFAHRRENDAHTYSLNRMKAQMAGGTTAGNGEMSAVQLETIQALNATLDMGRMVLKEKPKFGTGWGINWWESLGNYMGWANPEWHSFKQMVTTQLNTYVNNLTGKQLSKHEVSRLKGAVPQISDDDAVFTEKAKTFIKIQQIVLARKLRTYAMAGMNMTGFMGDRQLSWKVRGGTERTGTYNQFRENLRRNPQLLGKIDILTGPQGKPQRKGDSYLADIVGGFMIQDPVTGELKYNEAEYGSVEWDEGRAMIQNPAFRAQRGAARTGASLIL